MTSELPRLCETSRAAIPKLPPDPIEHAERTVQLPGSARSKHFRCSITPWIREIIYRATRCLTTRIVTFVKPVQSGGSVAGEVIICDWIQFRNGIIQYNWTDNEKSKDRWESRIERILNSNQVIGPMIAGLPRFDATKGEIDFGRNFFRMQGIYESKNLDSDSVPWQLNEEVHSWEPGHLEKARNRSTAIWFYKSVDISNAGKKGDQLHQAFLAGTQEHWELKCPGCSNPHHEANSVYHRMRTRWDDKHPELGGLRYDSKECRRENGEFDYNKLKSSLRFQMPCGLSIPDDVAERRALSLSGVYSKPDNSGADGTHRSYTYEAVTVDYISWLELVQKKHRALRARQLGDIEPWRRYRTECECLFYDPDEVPLVGLVTLSTETKKNREGLMSWKEAMRFFALDRQQGTLAKGELPHWWIVIRDVAIVDDHLQSLLVYEDKLETDEQVIAVLDDHKCTRHFGVADSGDDTMHVYTFCLRYGINAIKGGTDEWYSHQTANGKTRRIFSVERPLFEMIPGRESCFPIVDGVTDIREPLFWLYSKVGIRERLHWIRATTKWEVPGDVSEDYQNHMESEERISRKHPRTGEEIHEWRQLKSRNDLLVCEAYIAMQIEQAGFVREQPTEGKEK